MIEAPSAPLPHGFQCHPSVKIGLGKVFAGLYDIDIDPPPKVVLDLGANAGAFSLWALHRWPSCHVIAVEPAKGSLRYLYRNLTPEKWHPQVEIRGAAVTSKPGPYVFLHEGVSNTGQASLRHTYEQLPQGESVCALHPKDLPPCDFLKVDTEGAELDILTHYPHLGSVRALAMEWHDPAEIPALIDITSKAGLRLVKSDRDEKLFLLRRDAA